MTDSNSDLTQGERVIYATQLHWIVLVPAFLVGIAFCVLGLVLMAQPTDIAHRRIELPADPGWLGFLAIIIGIVVVGFGILRRESTELTLTNLRVTAVTGIVLRRTLEIQLPHVESIEIDRGAWGGLFGFGTVTLRGTGGTPETLTSVAHAKEFRNQVQQQLAALALR
jgi:uncharacterized membrane protein YdbT with pleckstrin-like domain